MVIRELNTEPFYLKINNKWVMIDEQTLRAHPGGSAITTYRNREASTVFHAFHGGSKSAYKMLAELPENEPPVTVPVKEKFLPGFDDVNMGKYALDEEAVRRMVAGFERLRSHVRNLGLARAQHTFYISKWLQALCLIALAIFLQSQEYFLSSALILGLAWQQLGWLIHDYCHHQHFQNRYHNDLASYVFGNLLQGFSSGGWKEQHNVHHAATNVVGRDGDLDLMPLFATVSSDLKLVDASWIATVLPYQHIYWSFSLPLLRLSWLLQSVHFVSTMHLHFYEIYRRRAVIEQITLATHWALVIVQLYLLPSFQIRLMYFVVSQLFSGWLTAHVVTYNHYSTDKFPHETEILDNYPCLQLYTTRNMRPGFFIDWLWGGLNYQIEHHLFPTMPRHNLPKVMPLVKAYCEEYSLPYMVDDYFTGWRLGIQQLANIADVARRFSRKVI